MHKKEREKTSVIGIEAYPITTASWSFNMLPLCIIARDSISFML